MVSELQRAHLTMVARTLQIIVVAMAAGVLIFGGIVLLIDPAGQGGGKGANLLLTYVAVGAAFVALIASAVVPTMIVSAARQKIVAGNASELQERLPAPPGPPEVGEAGTLAALFQTRTIISAAILEGAAFLSLIAYILEGHVLSLIAAGVMLLSILALFPSRSRLEDWVQNQLTVIAQLREMHPHDAR